MNKQTAALAQERARSTRQRLSKRGKVIISREPLHMQVAARLREMIVHNDLPPETKVPVTELSQMLDVSLTPLREALKVLAGEQLIDLTPNRGARVAPLTVAETEDLFQVIAELEPLAARLACERMTEQERADLEELHAKLGFYFSNREKTEYFDCNREIHDRILRYSRNGILIHARAQLAVRAERVRYFSVEKGPPRDEAMEEHERLMEALRAHDPERAQTVWHEHLLHAGRDTCKVLRKHQEALAAAERAAT